MTVVRDSSLLWTSLIGLMLTVGQPAARGLETGTQLVF